jgi:hypothetical protein
MKRSSLAEIAGATCRVEDGHIVRALQSGMSWDSARPSTWVMPPVPGAVTTYAAVVPGGDKVPHLMRGEFHG